ncbi:PfkB family carbohydrate kinase [Labedella endophytica]|uniref:PfkB family carbohydrate kinase n=1 Tax=Labedella endophytica TaxID=1523160 RepID=UPI001AA0104C|nr:PfkB family carbohydrate kinase [Labedella endophytica]
MSAPESGTDAFDVVVLGEVLLEVSTEVPVSDGVPARLGISGDALNVAAAAAAAGARTALLSVIGTDDLGDAIARRVAELGISTDLLVRAEGRQGAYLVHSDPDGEREFTYLRGGSVGSTLGPEHVDESIFARAGVVVASGITTAISDTARAAVVRAASIAHRFVFDPNHRPRLQTPDAARALIAELAPHTSLMTPSFPTETAMLGAESALAAGEYLRALGVDAVAVTCGSAGVQIVGDEQRWVDAVPAPVVVDQTGAGDSFVGSTAARLVAGDTLADAVAFGVAAASLVVGGRGGTGLVPSREQTLAHLAGSARG